VKPVSRSEILILGSDTALIYLIGRYAERSGYQVTTMQTAPLAVEVCNRGPAAILFPSLENLESSQALVAELAYCDIPVLVCSSVADEARARELGADHCLLHPLTYDGYLAALATTKAPGTQ
jgi:CheY-like chemotaxis protein